MPTVTHHLPGLRLTDHFFNVPLDHAAPEGERLEIYAREVVAPSKAERSSPFQDILLIRAPKAPTGCSRTARPSSRNRMMSW